MALHSRWGGSIADRYMSCAGSSALVATVPPRPSSAHAEEGTLAHAFGEYMLREGDRDVTPYVGATLDGKVGAVPLTQEMANAVQLYLDAVWLEMDKTADAQLFVEHSFTIELSSAEPGEVFGTNDAMVYHPSTGRLVVFDYKHGVGVSVSAEDNAQLKFYAAGAAFSHADWPISEIELVIVQPRARDVDVLGAVRPWPISPLDLMDFQVDLDDAIAKAKAIEARGVDTADLTAGSWCRWCDAAAICPAKEQAVLQAAQLDFASITDIDKADLPKPSDYDTDRLGEILKAAYMLNDWLRQIEEHVEGLVVHGTPVKGWKAVAKVGRAAWSAPAEDIVGMAEMLFDIEPDEIYPRKLVGLSEFEKALKVHKVAKDEIVKFKTQYTKKESSGLTLAPESDKRPAVDLAARDFASLNLDGLQE